jgi:micrococcal nuclease
MRDIEKQTGVLLAVACALALFVFMLTMRHARAELELVQGTVLAIDGDTIVYRHERIRILGIDAPEIHPGVEGFKCQAERELGIRAREALTELTSPRHRVTIRRAHDRWGIVRRDRYGRALAWVYSDGRNVAVTLIADGLAHAYNGQGPRAPWCCGDALCRTPP